MDFSRRDFLAGSARAGLLLPALAWAACGAEPEPPARGAGEEAPSGDAAAGTGAGTGAAGAGEPAGESAAGGAGEDAGPDGALVTEIDSTQPVVEALQYTNESPDPDERCDNCRFYVKRSEDRGGCQMFQRGLVTAGGWCNAWEAKV